MAVLKDLIVHGRSHFINGAQFNTINAESIGADAGIFNKLIATTLDATTASIDDLTAKNATVTALLDVQGDMHTNSWSNSNIATIDGSFYITPTSVSSDGSNIDASNYTPTGTITYASSNFTKISITGTFDTSQLTLNDNAHVAWPANSEVIVTGDVLVGTEWLPLGTIRGKLESQVAATNASKTISVIPLSTTLTDGQGHMPVTLETIRIGINLSSGTSTALKMRKVKVSLTSRASGSTQYPVGILLSAQGTGTGQTFIDIYGGNNARNGQSGTINGSTKTFTKPMVRLGNLEGLPKIANQTPSGWGIYTSNGFFEGAIVAKEGYIGNTGAYWTIGGGTSSGATYMYSGPSTVSATSTAGTYLGTNGFLNTASSTTYAQITNGVLTAQGAIINGALTATSLSTGNPARTSSGTGTAGTYIASDGAIYVGSNNNFTVTAAGAVTAKSGTIGGWSINSSYGIYTNSKTSATSTNSGILIQKDGNIYAGAYNSTAASCPFQVTNTGVLTAVNANLKGLTIYDAGTTPLGSFTASSGNATIKLGQEAANKFNILITDTAVSSKGPGILLRQGTDVLNEITADGMKLYLASDTTNSIAEFGDNIRIGATSTGHAVLDDDGMDVYIGETPVAHYGDYARIGKDGKANTRISPSEVSISAGDNINALRITPDGNTQIITKEIDIYKTIKNNKSLSYTHPSEAATGTIIKYKVVSYVGEPKVFTIIKGTGVSSTTITESTRFKFRYSATTTKITVENLGEKDIRLECASFKVETTSPLTEVGGVLTVGQYPDVGSNTVFAVGNGTEGALSCALNVRSNGYIQINGSSCSIDINGTQVWPPKPTVHAELVNANINKAYSGHVSVTAPNVSGYQFLCWAQVATDGWVGTVYPSAPMSQTSDMWNALTGASGQTGTGLIHCLALYIPA